MSVEKYIAGELLRKGTTSSTDIETACRQEIMNSHFESNFAAILSYEWNAIHNDHYGLDADARELRISDLAENINLYITTSIVKLQIDVREIINRELATAPPPPDIPELCPSAG